MAKFMPPTVDEVNEYIKQQNLSIDANTFCDYYESIGWMRGKTKMKSWQAAARTWDERQRNNIKGKDDLQKHEEKNESMNNDISDNECNMIIGIFQNLANHAYQMFKEDDNFSRFESPIERMMYICLKTVWRAQRGKYSFVPPMRIISNTQIPNSNLPYRVDFLIVNAYDKKPAMVIECDGNEYHHSTQEQINNDYARERKIVESGIPVIRFTGSEIVKDPVGCAEIALGIYRSITAKKIEEIESYGKLPEYFCHILDRF